MRLTTVHRNARKGVGVTHSVMLEERANPSVRKLVQGVLLHELYGGRHYDSK